MVSAKAVEDVEADVLGKADNLETRLVKTETTLHAGDGCLPVKAH